MSERLSYGPEPTVICDQSLNRLPFIITPHVEEFGRLAREVGIPEGEVANIKVHLVHQDLLGPLTAGEFDNETKDVTIAISPKRKRLGRILRTTAHELDHYNYFLSHSLPKLAEESRFIRLLRFLASEKNPFIPLAAPAAIYLNRRDIHSYFDHEWEVHARETAKRIEMSGKQFNLIDVADKPRRLRMGSRRLTLR